MLALPKPETLKRFILGTRLRTHGPASKTHQKPQKRRGSEIEKFYNGAVGRFLRRVASIIPKPLNPLWFRVSRLSKSLSDPKTLNRQSLNPEA